MLLSILVLCFTVVAPSASIAFASTPGTWSPTGSMIASRVGHTMTLLPGGKVLVAGGESSAGVVLRTAELYDPATRSWRQTGSMLDAASVQTAVLLPNGKVLVAGGDGRANRAELYDPATGIWSAARSMSTPRLFNTATLLPSGKVLIAGGDDAGTAELYDPVTGTWTSTGSMRLPRKGHFAVLLGSGKVLVSGNFVGSNESDLVPSELFDPDTGTWSFTGPMRVGRSNSPPAVLLGNGKVLVAGSGNFDGPLAAAELYDPVSGIWALTGSMKFARSFAPITLLADGMALIEGGDIFGNLLALESSELYDPTTGSWSLSGKLNVPRVEHTARMLNDSTVLIAGGLGAPGTLAKAELFTPPTATRFAPTCGLTGSGVDQTGHAFIKVAARDFGSGLRSVQVLASTNVSVKLPAFPPGFQEPGVVTATKIDGSRRSDFTLGVTNMAGQLITCDPVVTHLVVRDRRPAVEVLRELSSTENNLTISNATPGLERMTAFVNGHRFQFASLRDGETRTLQIADAMRKNGHNTVVLIGQGPNEASAVVVAAE